VTFRLSASEHAKLKKIAPMFGLTANGAAKIATVLWINGFEASPPLVTATKRSAWAMRNGWRIEFVGDGDDYRGTHLIDPVLLGDDTD